MRKGGEDAVVKKVRAENESIDRAYRHVFSTKYGQVVLDDIAKFCCVHTTTFMAAGEKGTNAMLINEGARGVFLRIAQKIRLDYTKYYRENDGREQSTVPQEP